MRVARDIPSAFLHADLLEEFRLSGQAIDALPEDAPPMPCLRVLDLSLNQLRHLPAWVFEIKGLEVLNLKGNQLDFLPSAIHRLRALTRLHLDQNPLIGLPVLPAGLQEVHLNGCLIERFPEALFKCAELQVIEMKDCRIREWPSGWSLPPLLQVFDLQSNRLTGFPHALLAATHVQHLRLHDNPFLESLGGNRFADTLASFFADSARRNQALVDRACQLDILLEDHVRAGLHGLPRLLDSLEAPFPLVREKAMMVLPKVIENPFLKPLPAEVCLLGRFTSFKVQEAKDALSLAGCRLLAQAKDANTLVVIGTSLGRQLAEARAKGPVIALEQHLLDWLRMRQGHFLDSAGPDNPMVANLMALLASFQAPNIDMAIAIMGGGGIPVPALHLLLAIRLFHPEPEVRNAAAAAWQPAVPAYLRDAVAKAWKEAQLADGLFNAELLLRRLLPRPELDGVSLIRTAMHLQKAGLNLVHLLPGDQQPELYQLAVQRGSLSLARLGLERVPDGVFAVQGLQGLSLASNKLTEVPDAISGLSTLTMLDLSNNGLTRLSQGVAMLSQLVSLDLSGNRLQEYPEHCCDMPELMALRLNHNPIAVLPDAFPGLTGLEYLGLRGLPIHEVPSVVGKMPHLRELDLGQCGLSALPDSLRGLSLLEGINLDRNLLAVLPDWIGELPRLRHLDLSYLPLTYLPAGLTGARRLERIYLLQDESMDWRQVADVLAQIPTLRHVYFKRYKIVAEMERFLERKIGQARVQFVD